ncbi:GDP-mannose 4,6-dehydratase [Streptomyces sp. N50]|uniref:GDP-mannose 4,6-dehydratase n=1 Tax=Streptomyces sp. N50 TaxID=3081765 RepID=UPI0029620F6C|nr:GDP-mannose 4,6-dehydratase [Streptomyces sp. N50]WOX12157.1 GDP-mannose 4,6-dehydratase [Streptomyces sp. N50]
MKQVALITGIAGQDGSYLTELLLSKGYFIIGFDNHSERMRQLQIRLAGNPLRSRVLLELGDVCDRDFMARLISSSKPDEIYNLAAQSHVGVSFQQPKVTADTALAIKDLLEISLDIHPVARIFQASTSEMFGDSPAPQTERSDFNPLSPYAEAKLEAHEFLIEFRQKHSCYACAGILFNHESPRRREEFVSRKIARGIAQIVSGDSAELRLGNLAARRDWGHAKEYVEAMWLMLQQEHPEEFVIATGESHSVKEFAASGFALVGEDWRDYVVSDQEFFRPSDPPDLCGDAEEAYRKLTWQPKIPFAELVREMLLAEIRPNSPALRRAAGIILNSFRTD